MKPDHVKRVALRGFKSIAKMDLELRPLTVLIGANGAGKSNFLGFFTLMRHVAEGNLQVYTAQAGGADQLLHYGQKTMECIPF